MSSNVIQVNSDRLCRWLSEVAEIGLEPSSGEGLYRLSLSANDMRGREWLISKMCEHGLDVYIDGALNIHGRINWPENLEKPTVEIPAIVTGSHNDTVPGGGNLDGTLGVLAGLEALVTLKELNVPLQYPMEVIDFTDEEGRFGGMLGSMCLAGKLNAEAIESMVAADGVRVADCLAAHDRSPSTASGAKYNSGTIKSYVELHIEQGPVLDQTGENIGIVTAIVGLWKAEFTLGGQANHAGTTPMNMRRNAFLGCARLQVEIESLLQTHGSPSSVCTIGKVDVHPGGANVVPGKCVFTLELRDPSSEVIDSLSSAVISTLQNICDECRLDMSYRIMSNISAVPCDAAIQDQIHQACDNLNLTKRVMPSGAAHDAQNIPEIGPMGMIFVPSVNGVSHHHTEYTKDEDIVRGANVLLNTLYRLGTQ